MWLKILSFWVILDQLDSNLKKNLQEKNIGFDREMTTNIAGGCNWA